MSHYYLMNNSLMTNNNAGLKGFVYHIDGMYFSIRKVFKVVGVNQGEDSCGTG